MIDTFKIGLGTGHLHSKPYEDALKFFSLAFELHDQLPGKFLIDTAEVYGAGKSESMLGKILRETNVPRASLFIASKVSPENLTKEKVRSSCLASLKRLGCSYLDLYQIHWANPAIDIFETFEALEELKAEGLIRQIGVCNFTTGELRQIATRFRVDAVQLEYNLNNTMLEETHLHYCKEHNITIIAYSPYDRGTIKYHDNYGVLGELTNKYGKTPDQIALAYLIQQDNVVCIPETINILHHVTNTQANFKLDAQDIAQMADLFYTKTALLSPKILSAIEKNNSYNICPSPSELAKNIARFGLLKPVKVAAVSDGCKIIEGRARYEAYLLAYGADTGVPCMITKEPL